MMAFFRSCSPPSIFLISPVCTSWSSASSACENSASTGSPASAHSTSTARSSLFFLSDSTSSRSCSRRRRCCMTRCASAWSFQKSGAAARDSRRVSSSSGRAASKMTPKIFGALAEVFVTPHQLVDGAHALFYTATERQQRDDDHRRRVDQNIAVPLVKRRRAKEPRVADEHCRLIDRRLRDDAPIGIDDAADAGVGGAHQIPPFLDRAHARLREMLVG